MKKKLNLQRAAHKFYLLERNAPEIDGYENIEVTQDELLDLFNKESSSLKLMHFIPKDGGDWVVIGAQFKSLKTQLLDEMFEIHGF